MTRFCSICFLDPGLRRRLADLATASETDPCDIHPDQPGIAVRQIVDVIDPVFRAYHYRTEDDNRGEELADSLAHFLEADKAVADAIADALVFNERGDAPFYVRATHYEHHTYISSFDHRMQWFSFREGILHDRRFFNPDAKYLLDSLFSNHHLLTDAEGGSAVYRLPKETYIFRARVADNDEHRKSIVGDPYHQLGPPPVKLRRAGRMNPAGILTFYGALDIDTCIAELRPARRRAVVAGTFNLIRPIWVLDLSFFSRREFTSDLFNANHVRESRQWNFLSEFVDEISQPIFPEDEVFDYIPTQVVAEYLSNYEFEIDNCHYRVEALIYPSAQNTGGRNIVFLAGAAEVADPEADATLAHCSGKTAALGYVDNSVKTFRVDFDYSAWEIKNDPFA